MGVEHLLDRVCRVSAHPGFGCFAGLDLLSRGSERSRWQPLGGRDQSAWLRSLC